MALSLDDIDFLQTAPAVRVLTRYADADLSAANTLPILTELRNSLSIAEAAAVLTTLRLRAKAKTKFPQFAGDMLFAESGLQQASHPLVRRYRAGLIDSDNVLDLCCGIGADSLAFAAAGSDVLGLDIDPVRIAIARHNAAAMGLKATFQVADVRREIPTGYDCVFFDPGRRDDGGRRIHHVERYKPPLSLAAGIEAREVIVKLSPGLDLKQLATYGGQVEFVSASGQLTEALLWLHFPESPPKATLLTERGNFHLCHRHSEPVEIT
ncbi:MAG: methyltransferase domain-containing protein, partial [Chloroflexi bacterium]|nr:methyltransferase domain-containing protein [Chloroflexota bacterium]